VPGYLRLVALTLGLLLGLPLLGAGAPPRRDPNGDPLPPDALGEDELARRLRLGNPAVMGRVRGGKLLLDVRTLFAHQEMPLLEAVRGALSEPGTQE
jgi:L-seryl-tRNA(Ser) seleniumtransferase